MKRVVSRVCPHASSRLIATLERAILSKRQLFTQTLFITKTGVHYSSRNLISINPNKSTADVFSTVYSGGYKLRKMARDWWRYKIIISISDVDELSLKDARWTKYGSFNFECIWRKMQFMILNWWPVKTLLKNNSQKRDIPWLQEILY